MVTSEPLVQLYSLDKEVTLTTNEKNSLNETTSGGVSTQNDHPVIYISGNLATAEQKHSNIEREALAVVFAVTRREQFFMGKNLILSTGHRPLHYIFNPINQVPKNLSARLARSAIALMSI